MITELRLENWKSFGEATLYIDPLSILIGTNASGKSNVLDALLFLQKIASGASCTDALKSIRGGLDWAIKKNNDSFGLCVFFNFKEEFFKYCISCYVSGDKCFTEEEIFSHSKNNVFIQGFGVGNKGYKGNSEVAMLYIFYNQRSESWSSGMNFSAFIGLVDFLKNVLLFDPSPSSMIGYSPLSDKINNDASNIAGVLAALAPEQQKEIEDTLTEYARRLPESEIYRVYAEKVGKLGKDAMLYCDEKWGESGEVFTVDARAMSDGTLRFLAILTALLTLPEGSLLAIDEVDNGFHPSRAHLLLEALQTIGKQRNIDVLVTTHNPALLDALGTEFVPFVTVAHRDSITGESKLTLLEDIEQLPKLLAQGTVGKLSTQGLIEKSLESVHG
jgi:predicted ATPase